MITNIIIKFRIEGIHHWPYATKHAGESVSFLESPHRHMFHITCKMRVSHNDRDVEIIKFKREVMEYMRENYKNYNDMNHDSVCQFNSMSCEMIAENLAREFNLSYCEVLEDGENGAEVWYG